MTWLDAGAPAALRPGARPRTTLTPTLVLRDGRAEIALGTPGGDQQDQWQLPVLLRMIVGGYIAAAGDRRPVAAHHGAGGLVLAARRGPRRASSSRTGSATTSSPGSSGRGHDVTRAGDWSLGRVSAVGRDAATGVLWAAANPRGMQGYAAGR